MTLKYDRHFQIPVHFLFNLWYWHHKMSNWSVDRLNDAVNHRQENRTLYSFYWRIIFKCQCRWTVTMYDRSTWSVYKNDSCSFLPNKKVQWKTTNSYLVYHYRREKSGGFLKDFGCRIESVAYCGFSKAKLRTNINSISHIYRCERSSFCWFNPLRLRIDSIYGE